MTVRLAAWIVSASLAVGVGFGLVASGKSFVLEATNTPLGSFVLKYKPTYTVPLPSPIPFDKQLLDDHIA